LTIFVWYCRQVASLTYGSLDRIEYLEIIEKALARSTFVVTQEIKELNIGPPWIMKAK
jgi:hypothetical protein